ncbi:MAG: hypothetical protein U1E23_19755 [Reyranellaceae bacterium]
MATRAKRTGFAPVSGDDAALAAYALTQSMIATLVGKKTLDAEEAAALLRRAGSALRRRSDGFARAASLLEQEARFWSAP